MEDKEKLIELVVDLPIDKKHGALKGEVFELTGTKRAKNGKGRLEIVYFKGVDGSKCGAYPHEFRFID